MRASANGVTRLVAPGPEVGHGYSHLAGSPRVTLRHVSGALFVTGQDVAETGVEQRVVCREDGAAGNAEYHLDFLLFECLDECLCTGDGAHSMSLLRVISGGRVFLR